MKDKKIHKTAFEFIGITALLMLLFSCISFDIGDWPSKFVYPHNNPTGNWCGSIGAFFAYYLLYYIGPGVFVLLTSAISFLVARMTNRTGHVNMANTAESVAEKIASKDPATAKPAPGPM